MPWHWGAGGDTAHSPITLQVMKGGAHCNTNPLPHAPTSSMPLMSFQLMKSGPPVSMNTYWLGGRRPRVADRGFP